MVKLIELPIGLKGGFLNLKVEYDASNWWFKIPIKVTGDTDETSAECSDVNLYFLMKNFARGTLVVVETPIFMRHYVIHHDGKIYDYSMFFDNPSEFKVLEIVPKDELYMRNEAHILAGFPVSYRLYKSKEGKEKYLVGITPYIDGIELSIWKYVGNGDVIDYYSFPITSEINFSLLDEHYDEILKREKYNLEKIVEEIKANV